MSQERRTGPQDGPRYHVIDLDDAPTRGMRDDRGIRTLVVHPELGASKVDLHINRIASGDPGGRFHMHRDAENVYLVLSGTAVLQVDDVEEVLTEGQAVFIPPGVPHGVRNIGDNTLEVLEVYAPAPPDFTEVERPQVRERRDNDQKEHDRD